jgi:aspartyl aminopeptidase
MVAGNNEISRFKKIKYERKNGWELISSEETEKIFSFCEGYKKFMDLAKTEREATREIVSIVEKGGFRLLDDIIKKGEKLNPGDKVYTVNREKAVLLAVIGEEPIEKGINLVASHIDAPRIDIKQNPLYEDSDMLLMKTHYYGGIKKYQWTSIPLALHGVVIKSDMQRINVTIGEDESDPVFSITDLLPHLAGEQMDKKMSEGITGEGLNILSGSILYRSSEDSQKDEIKDKIRVNILDILNKKYGIEEEDFVSAELEIVPAFKAKDIGFDMSMIGAYAQDDRVCAYTSLKAILDVKNPKRTAICFFADKEEVGSMGNTGMQSRFFEDILAEMCRASSSDYSDITIRRALSSSKALSADVSALVDPNYEGVHDKNNAPYINNGVVLTKYTGSRGKAGTSDANAEFVAEVRRLLNNAGIVWQTGELGKVDQGGGGTVAQFIANLGVDVIDCGVGLLSMHSPFEISGKLDVYMAYRLYNVFLIEG